jgi:hypothetical protein
LFEFATSLSIETVFSNDLQSLPAIDMVANEFAIDVALSNRSRKATPACWPNFNASAVDEIEDEKSLSFNKIQQPSTSSLHLIETKHVENRALSLGAGICLGRRCATLW